MYLTYISNQWVKTGVTPQAQLAYHLKNESVSLLLHQNIS